MCFLFATLLARQVLATLEQGLLIRMSQEALLIPGWVTLWEPAYIFISGWWPIVQKRKNYDKITTMGIEVLPLPAMKAISPSVTPGVHAAT
jgi:hypothetical protein